MIYTTYYANLRNIPKGISVYAISNGIPTGLTLPHFWQAVPSWNSVQQYKKTGDWERFKARYLQLLETRGYSAWAELINSGRDIVLVCYEKDPAQCHRSVLSEWLNNHYGLSVKEWGCA